MTTTIAFNGVVPGNYQDILTPLLFDRFSARTADWIDFTDAKNVLELAAGTGSLTRQLADNLPAGAHLLATDLQGDMLELAAQRIHGSNISWDVVDMTDIPYVDNSFDLIVCQFGLMLVPDKEKALSEILRVLKPGGRFVYSVWADIAKNPLWEIAGNVIARHLGNNPMHANPGPFALAPKTANLRLLRQAGFFELRSSLVKEPAHIPSAALAAKGFIQGLPVYSIINEKSLLLLQRIQQEVATAYTLKLGDHPLKTHSEAWVFEAIKE